MQVYAMTLGTWGRALKRYRAGEPRGKQLKWWPKLLEWKVGKGRVFLGVTDDALRGISLTRSDLLRLVEEIDERAKADATISS